MKKVVRLAALFMVGGSLIFTSCGKKDDDPTPTPPDTKTPSGTEVCQSDKKTTYVLVDASTNAGTAASKGKSFVCNVTTTQMVDSLYLDIKAQKNIERIYILKSEDNGNSVPVTFTNTLTLENGKQITSNSSDYSYQVPNGIDAFKVKIPVNTRTSATAVSDVYTIWITSGNGDFSNTGKRTIVGPFTVALNYKANTTSLISANGIVVGSQQATEPSYVTTFGTIGTLSGVRLGEDLAGEEKVTALNSVDFSFITLNTAGTALGDVPYLISVSERGSVGAANSEGTAVTTFAEYTGDFAAATGSTLAGLTSTSVRKIAVQQGKTYSYVTQDGRKGLVRFTSISAGTGGGSKASIDIKVTTSK